MSTPRPAAAHIGIDTPGVIVCWHCGRRQVLTPNDIDVVLAISRQFSKNHSRCRRTPAGDAMRERSAELRRREVTP